MFNGFGLKNTLFSIASGMAFAYSMRLENENNLGVSPSVLNVGVGIIFLFALYKLYSEKSFPIHMKSLSGRTDTIWVNKDTTVAECQKSIAREYNLLGDKYRDLRLIFAGKGLYEEGKRMIDYNVGRDSTINVATALKGN